MAILTKNDSGIYTDANGSSLGSLAPSSGFNNNIFSARVAQMLTQLQDTKQKGSANLGGAANALTTEAVGAGGAYDPLNTPEGNVANATGARTAFTPALTSINTQLENANSAATLAQGNISILKDVFKPEAVPQGSTLVTPQGNVIYNGHSYTPQIRLDTGAQDSYDSVTGKWLSDVKANNNTTTPQGPTAPGTNVIVAGVDFSGKSTRVGAYDTDPNYSTEVNGIYNDIEKHFPTPTAQNLQSYIENNAGKGKSPVTGQMIMNAATTYGVDPNVLTAVLNQESDFGTAGAATSTMNPGNVGNTGTSTRGFNSWQAGVNAAAQEVARRMEGNVHAKSTTPTSTASAPKADPKGNLFNPLYANRVAALPASVKNYVLAGPGGAAYIDGDTANAAGLGQVATLTGPKAGIPVLGASGVQAMTNINTMTQQMEEMQKLIDKNLSAGPGGVISGFLNTHLNTIAQNKPDLTTMQNYIQGVTTAANNLKTLAGGQGSGLRITGYELGDVGASLPTTTDNWGNAKAKIDALNLKISQMMHTQFPDVDPYSVVKPQSQTPTSNMVAKSDIQSLRAKYKY